jgi:hypothetical protein
MVYWNDGMMGLNMGKNTKLGIFLIIVIVEAAMAADLPLKPKIIFFLADDMGWGGFSSLQPGFQNTYAKSRSAGFRRNPVYRRPYLDSGLCAYAVQCNDRKLSVGRPVSRWCLEFQRWIAESKQLMDRGRNLTEQRIQHRHFRQAPFRWRFLQEEL